MEKNHPTTTTSITSCAHTPPPGAQQVVPTHPLPARDKLSPPTPLWCDAKGHVRKVDAFSIDHKKFMGVRCDEIWWFSAVWSPSELTHQIWSEFEMCGGFSTFCERWLSHYLSHSFCTLSHVFRTLSHSFRTPFAFLHTPFALLSHPFALLSHRFHMPFTIPEHIWELCHPAFQFPGMCTYMMFPCFPIWPMHALHG